MYMTDQGFAKERKWIDWDVKQKRCHILKSFFEQKNMFCTPSSSWSLVCSAHCTLTPYLWNGLVLDKIDFAEQRESSVSIKARALWSSAQNIKHGQFQLSAWSPTVSYLNAQVFRIISCAFGWRLLRTADMCSTPGHKPVSNVWLCLECIGS